MATDIKFNKAGSLRYVAELTPDTPTVVQVKRLDKGYFTVYGSIGDMGPVSVFNTTILQNLIFQIDVPAGVKITMESETEVIEAKTL